MLKEYLSTIANKFREVTGETGKINAQDFADKIQYVYEVGATNGFNYGYEQGKLGILRDSKYMNAQVSGTAVAVNDVSPIEHNVKCNVASKNLFNPYEYILSIDTDGNAYIAADGGVNLSGGMDTGVEITYSFTTTEECVLSLTSDNYGTNVYYDNKDIGSLEANSLEHQIAVGIHTLRLVQGSQSNNTIYIQLEKGTTPTPYTPYLANLSSVEVSRYGKNLVDDSLKSGTLPNTFFGTTNYTKYHTTLPAGDYTLSVKIKDDVGGTTYLYVIEAVSGYPTLWSTSSKTLNFSLTERKTLIFKVYNTNFNSVDDLEYAQLEVGTTATIYKPYIKPTTYQATADGTVDGINSISPNMTLLTNNNNVVINVNYLRDIDTYIDNLITDVALTGGE